MRQESETDNTCDFNILENNIMNNEIVIVTTDTNCNVDYSNITTEGKN